MNPEDEADFQYIRDIAEGSFGRVCLFRRRDNTYCAGKIVYRDRFASDEPYEREYAGVCKFRELGIKSPLLLEIIHVRRRSNEDEFCYMMELADDARPESNGDWDGYTAKTLRWELQNSGQRCRLPSAECIARILLVAQGLEILHNAGLIHRDVKPANIIYVGGVPKLADIGLVADLKKDKARISATPAYEAPEGPISKMSDIYSLGMMLYELVSGQSPSQFPSRPNDIEAWNNRDQVFAILKVVYRACAPNPKDRYASVAGMRRDLEGIQTGTPLRRRFLSAFGSASTVLVAASILALGIWHYHKSKNAMPTPARYYSVPKSEDPNIAELLPTNRWTNSIGIPFIPVPGTKVLFAIWPTRIQDWEIFVKETDYQANGPMWTYGRNRKKAFLRGFNWQKPGYEFQQGPSHPVTGINWGDAKAFCDWLTVQERRSGQIRNDQYYRLPTDEEWSVAVGLTEERSGTPAEKSGKVNNQYPWGSEWPPPSGVGNYADETARKKYGEGFNTLQNYNDGYSETSPVGLFKPNKLGLYDMGGNVWQFCEDRLGWNGGNSILRGGAWNECDPTNLLSSARSHPSSRTRDSDRGFRCVLGSTNTTPIY